MTHLLRLTLSAMLIAPLLACGGADTPLPDLPVAQTGLPEAEGLSAWRRAAVDAGVDGRVWMGARSGFVVLVARAGQLIMFGCTDHETTKAAPPYNVANNAATGYQGALDAFNAFRNACGSCSTNFGGESEGSNDVSRGRN